MLEVARDAPVEKGTDVCERVQSFARCCDRLDGDGNIVVGDLMEFLLPRKVAQERALHFVSGAWAKPVRFEKEIADYWVGEVARLLTFAAEECVSPLPRLGERALRICSDGDARVVAGVLVSQKSVRLSALRDRIVVSFKRILGTDWAPKAAGVGRFSMGHYTIKKWLKTNAKSVIPGRYG